MTRQLLYYKAVTAKTVGLSDYFGGIPKPGSTYGHTGKLAKTTLVETETVAKVILVAVSAL